MQEHESLIHNPRWLNGKYFHFLLKFDSKHTLFCFVALLLRVATLETQLENYKLAMENVQQLQTEHAQAISLEETQEQEEVLEPEESEEASDTVEELPLKRSRSTISRKRSSKVRGDVMNMQSIQIDTLEKKLTRTVTELSSLRNNQASEKLDAESMLSRYTDAT